MDNVISVIVPVYNVAAYLPECVRSILSQDYPDLEVILIDDGSTDGSGRLCDELAAGDSRVKVIHQPNGGAASAKNAGLRIAGGTYLSFVDSDDFLEPNVYGYMVRTLEKTGADAVEFGFRDVYVGKTEAQIPQSAVLTAREYLLRFPNDWHCALLWNKLYRRKLFDGIFFEEGHRIDDEYFTYRGFLGEGKVVVDERIIYNYRKRASGAMNNPAAAEQLILDKLDCIVKRRELVCSRCPELKPVFDENYLDAMWYLTYGAGATQKTICLIRAHMRAYFRTPGNRFPPRWLWGRLWRAYFTPEDKLLRQINEQEKPDLTAFYP